MRTTKHVWLLVAVATWVTTTGFVTARSTVRAPTVVASESIRATSQTTGTLQLTSPASFEGATVFLNGRAHRDAAVTELFSDKGMAWAGGPVVVRVTKPGWGEWQTQAQVDAGKQTVVQVLTGQISVLSLPSQAQIYVDGIFIAPAPQSLFLALGRHRLAVRQPGYKSFEKELTILEIAASGSPEPIYATLVQEKPPTPPLNPQQAQLETSLLGATTLPQKVYAVGVFGGYPHVAGLQLTFGAWSKALEKFALGLDVSLLFRTTGYEHDAGIGARFQFVKNVAGFLSIAVDTKLLGGGGQRQRNSVEYQLGTAFTATLGKRGQFTFRPYLQVSSDQHCASESYVQDLVRKGKMAELIELGSVAEHHNDACVGLGGPGNAIFAAAGYNAMTMTATLNNASYRQADGSVAPAFLIDGEHALLDRTTNARAVLQGSFEVSLTPTIVLYGMVEGVPRQNARHLFTNKFNQLMAADDSFVYGMGGLAFKFNNL